MRRLSRLALPGYAVCLWLLFFPLLDTLALAIPPAPAEVEWRYSLTELLSRSLMTPMLGVFGLMLLASVFEHDGMRKFVGLVAWIGVALTVLLLGVFAFDSVGLRGGVRQGLAPVFSGPWIAAVVKLAVAAVVLFLVASASRGPLPEADPTEDRGDGGKGPGTIRRPLGAA